MTRKIRFWYISILSSGRSTDLQLRVDANYTWVPKVWTYCQLRPSTLIHLTLAQLGLSHSKKSSKIVEPFHCRRNTLLRGVIRNSDFGRNIKPYNIHRFVIQARFGCYSAVIGQKPSRGLCTARILSTARLLVWLFKKDLLSWILLVLRHSRELPLPSDHEKCVEAEVPQLVFG